MRKLTLLLSAAVLAAPVAFGQKTQLQRLLQSPLETMHRNLQHLAGTTTSAAKTTAQQQRFIGFSALSVPNGNALLDSTRIRYNSMSRGSEHDPNDLNSYYFVFDPSSAYFPGVELLLYRRALRIKADTVTQSDKDGVYRTAGLSYNGANQPTQIRNSYYRFGPIFDPTSGYYVGKDRSTITYDATGQPTKVQYDLNPTTATPGNFTTESILYSRFEASTGRILSDSIEPVANPVYRTSPVRRVYSYTGNNLTTLDLFYLTNGIYEPLQRLTFSYDASNRIQIAEQFLYGNTGYEPYRKDSLTYTGSNLFTSGAYLIETRGGAYNITQSLRYTTNAQNLRDTARYYDVTGNLAQYTVYSYNSYGNPDSYRLYVPQNSTTTPEETGRFYYELYDPAAVNTVAATVQNLNAAVRPNPVPNAATLSWNAFAGTLTLHLTDAAGRLLETVQVPAAAGTYNLDMARYATGLYMATFQAPEGQKQTLKIVKQ